MVDAETSKITEFGLSLDGQATNWYSQHESGEFKKFKILTTKFIRLFHRQVQHSELMSQFYAVYQEAHEIVPQFIIRFQTLHRQLTSAPLEDEAKAVYLAALRESLRTMCVVLDFRTNTIDQVVDQVLEMDKNSSLMSMGALQRALPKDEDLRFRHVVQCTTCLNPDHSTIECTMRTHCMICH
mgnify:CR=1 FL=1